MFGTPDMGVASDLEKAYDAVEMFVADLHFYGFDCNSDYESSEFWRDSKTYRMSHEIERYYQLAKKILIENREFLNDVSEALLNKQTITFKDIEEIKKHLDSAEKSA